MHDTPPGPHDPGPDAVLVGELRELMEEAAAGLAPLPDLTQEAVRLGRRRRFRARAAVVGAVTGVLAAGGIGSAALGGVLNGGQASPSVRWATPAAPLTPVPTPETTLAPAPVPEATPDAVHRKQAAEALSLALGDWIGPVTPSGTDLFVGRRDGHAFPVRFQAVPDGSEGVAPCPGALELLESESPESTGSNCRTAWQPDGRIQARVTVAYGEVSGLRSVSVLYRYAGSTVKLAVDPDTAARVSPPVTADQVLSAAVSAVLLPEATYLAKGSLASTGASSSASVLPTGAGGADDA